MQTTTTPTEDPVVATVRERRQSILTALTRLDPDRLGAVDGVAFDELARVFTEVDDHLHAVVDWIDDRP